MVHNMAPTRNLRPGYTVIFPNREKASSKVTKAIVMLLLVISAVLMAIVTVGGWKKLEGLRPVNFLLIFVYLVLAFYLRRWNRGLLPMVAALAILMLIVALIAGTGTSGTSWFDRAHAGYGATQMMFGGKGLSPDMLGQITLLIVPVQALLIFFSLHGFSQGWNVEQEVPEEEAERRRGGGRGGTLKEKRARIAKRSAAANAASPPVPSRRRPSPTARRDVYTAGGIRTHTSRRTMPFEGIVSTVPPPPRGGRV